MLAKDALALQERVDKIAQGAAMMTETTVKKRFIDGCSNTVPNKTLETLFWKNFNEVVRPGPHPGGGGVRQADCCFLRDDQE